MKPSEKAARKQLQAYDVHTDRRGGTPVGDTGQPYTHKETKLQSIRGTIRALKGK